MELWERATALNLLDDLLRESAQGGRVVVVAGEAGIGKSALVTEFVRRCGNRARVMWGACDRLVTPRALGPLHDIARQSGGVLADRLAAGATQEDIFSAFLDELTGPRQRQRPVVVVEDAHWADEATIDLLVLVGRRIGRLPALLVLTYRDDEVGADHPLRGALAAMPSGILRRVAPEPLSLECVTEQAKRAGRDPDRIYQRSGGNPLLVTELLKAGDRAVPPTAKDLILDRMRVLPEPARQLARLVAVIPTRADAALVAGSSDLVELCLDAGVLVPAGDGVSFRHELLRGAVEESLSPTRRVALHRQVLRILVGVDRVDPARLVHHARHAGDIAAVLKHARIAGAGAAAQGAHREAAAHYRAAAAHADRLPAVERAELLEDYAVEAYLAGVSEEGLEARRAALAVREELGQPERVGENLRWISRLAWWTGRAAEARAAGERAVVVLETLPRGRQLAMAYSNKSQLHMLADEPDDAVAWGERARDLADELGDVDTSLHATINVHSARYDPRAEQGLLEAHAAAAAAGLVDHAARALVNLTSAMLDMSQCTNAAGYAERALAYAEEHELEGYVQYLLGIRASIRLELCDWTGALADVEASLSKQVRRTVAVLPALVTRGRIQAARGDAAALSTLDEAAQLAERMADSQRVVPVAAARSELFLLAGDTRRAADEARRGLGLAVSFVHPVRIGEMAYRLWRAGGPDQAPDAAAEPYQMMMSGDWAAAAEVWAKYGCGYAEVEALSAGDQAAASQALRTLDELGATRAAQRLRGELRRRGITGIPRGPRPVTAGSVAGLTPRQLGVLSLLAEGLSNAEIAGRLMLSAKTVDHHVSAVLAKLGVANRGQAAALAYRLDLTADPEASP